MTRPVAANLSTASRFSVQTSSNCSVVSRRSAGNRKLVSGSKGAAEAEADVAGLVVRVNSSDLRWCLPSWVGQTAAWLLHSSACPYTSA